MSEPIKVGDMAVVVKGCCAEYMKHLGYIFRVTIVSNYGGGSAVCSYCRSDSGPQLFIEDDSYRFRSQFVRRIPPLSELESEKRDEKLTEPA